MAHDGDATRANPLAQARDLAFVCAVFLFFLGFSYERDLLSLFGIASLSGADTFSFIAFSADAVRFADRAMTVWYSVAAAVLILAVIGLHAAQTVGNVSGATASRLLLVVTVLVAFPALRHYAAEASKQARAKIMGGGGIPVAVVQGKDKIPAELRASNDACYQSVVVSPTGAGCRLRLIYESDDVAYICDAGDPVAFGRTFAVQKADGDSIVRISRP